MTEAQLETVGELITSIDRLNSYDDPVYVASPSTGQHFVVVTTERVEVEGEKRSLLIVRPIPEPVTGPEDIRSTKVCKTKPSDDPWHVVEYKAGQRRGALMRLTSPRGGLIRYDAGIETRCGVRVGGHWHGGYKENSTRPMCGGCV